MSMVPTSLTAFSQSACLVTSRRTKRPLSPSSLATAAPLSLSTSATTTLAPWAPNCRAVAAPMPDAAPVMNTFFPERSTSLPFHSGGHPNACVRSVLMAKKGKLPLDGMTAVVTAGGGAIGSATAGVLVRDGAHVLISGRTQEKLDRVVDSL